MNRKIVTSDEFKLITKELLGWVDMICEKNNIHYFGAYGTLIGAIRHNGFIPWDDDIDICMLRADYDKFIEIISNLNDPQHYLLASNTEKGYYNNFARICDRRCILKIKGTLDIPNFGAFVDVFPLDKVPEAKVERIKFYKELEAAYSDVVTALPFRSYNTLSLKRRIGFWKKHLAKVGNIFKRKNLIEFKNTRDELMKKYNLSSSQLVSCLFDTPDDKLIMRLSDITEVQRHVFEDIEINIPRNYDSILKSYYGDYMRLPDENQRYSHHHFTPYWNNKYLHKN
nr:LicD family protein [uncultured Mediterraneibacter sp.]